MTNNTPNPTDRRDKLAIELSVLSIAILLAVLGQGLASMLFLAGHGIGYQYGKRFQS